MNLFKNILRLVIIIVSVCIVNSDGSILLPLLIEVIALKGALFIGTPIALGSFVVGQGLGYIAGNLAGGYAMFKGAQNYHEKQKAKWASSSRAKGYGGYWGGYGSYGWRNPKYTRGYARGFGIRSGISHVFNYIKPKPSYQGDSGNRGYGSYSAPSHVSSHQNMQGSYDPWVPPRRHGSHGGYASLKALSFLNQFPTKLPEFLSVKAKVPAPSYTETYGAFKPLPDDVAYSALYAFMESQPSDQSFSQPGISDGYPHAQADLPPTPPESAETTQTQKAQLDNSSMHTYNPQGSSEGENVFEDSEYTYSSSPYAKPQPKRPETGGYVAEIYPGDATSPDGPTKEYTGIVTDTFQTMQNMKTNTHGVETLGNRVGSNELTTDPYLLSSTEKDEQMLDIASSLHSYAQKRKDTESKPNAPSYATEEFLEKELASKATNEDQRKEVKQIITTLGEAYLKQLEQSPHSEYSVNDHDGGGNVDYFPNLQTVEKLVSEQLTNYDPLSNFARSGFNRKHLENLGARIAIDKTTAEASSLQNLNSDELKPGKMLNDFLEEIKQFFTIVSALDEDTCLQKMVCEVHAQKSSSQPQEQDNAYVSNMISTFRLLDVIAPFDSSRTADSTTKYRLAAKMGNVGGSTDVCRRHYSVCSFTSDEIIQLGNQVSAATIQPTFENDVELTTSSHQFQKRLQRKQDDEEAAMPKV